MNQTHQSVGDAIGAQLLSLSTQIVDDLYTARPSVWAEYKDEGRAKSIRDTRYHLSYLAEAIRLNNTQLFSDYLAWAKVLFAGIDLPPDTLTTTLDATRRILLANFPPDAHDSINHTIDAGLEQLPQMAETLPEPAHKNEHLAPLQKSYLEALLTGKRHEASQLIMAAVQNGTAVRDLYLHVFQHTQHEIGRLWQMNKVSVAQEHYCTAATQLIMSQLYPYIFSTKRNGRSMVAACVGGELHEMGVRMVADFFEMEGWDTYYLGANTPTETILQAIDQRQPDIVAISTTITFHMPTTTQLIDQIRQHPDGDRIKILVGGYPFNKAPNLWQQVGADSFAANASDALAAAERILSPTGS